MPWRFGALALIGLLACRQAGPTTERPNFLIVDIDSLRADRVGWSRDGELVAPALSSLARRGAHFTHAVAQAGWTLPSLGALLSGRAPLLVEIQEGGLPMGPRDRPPVPEIFGFYGYHTVAFWGGTIVGPHERFSRGFADWKRSRPGRREDFGHEVADWLAARPPEPFFAFVHDYDLHMPVPPVSREVLHRHVPDLPECPGSMLRDVAPRLAPLLGEEAARAHAIAHYDATLGEYDRILARIVAALETSGLASRTVLWITSDHGEDLFEHLGVGHGSQYEVVLHIPLIVIDPASDGPRIIEHVVQTLDIAPTLLERAGIPIQVGMEGRSLLPLLATPEGPFEDRDIYVLSHRHGAAIRSGRWKLLTRSPWESYGQGDAAARRRDDIDLVPLVELYDLDTDPGETRELGAEEPERREALLTRLQAWREQRELEWENAPVERLDPPMREALKAHGYWDLVQPSPTAR